MPIINDNSPAVEPEITVRDISRFVVGQCAAIGPFAAMVLFPPATIPLAALSIGTMVGMFKSDKS